MKAIGASRLSVRRVSLDAECAGHEFEWGVVGPVLRRIHAETRPEDHVVVDVGAATQTLPELASLFVERGVDVVLVTAPPEEVILRQPIRGRDMAEFVSTEYTSREQLYSLARRIVDVAGLDKQDSGERALAAIIELLGVCNES